MIETLKYLLIDFWEQESDSRIISYPLMDGGPWLSWLIVIIYIYVVKIFGPRWMRQRPAMSLKLAIIMYDIMLIMINAYFFYQYSIAYRFGIDLKIHHFERISSESDQSSCSLLLFYMFMLSKYLDMMETIFFVLRKKSNQITTLHVYHHSIAPLLVHLYIKISPYGGPGTIFPLINSFVHTGEDSFHFLTNSLSSS
ncbi:hypothetical protein DERF_009355 [Dermatophagoides farinae]|uniref:Elongation of very long chain fatty acids protein n=1 Tax=Dermatophagoides farinae TaxID=6954 RepID=A0A922HUT0_DERFA|nr:elongation of very long chain fatty acids-like protein 2 [Dermatophagoides farinae]KAH9510854.1 hypothetical protein DERF_009355 [Dermatophagoides farinae]